MIHLLGNFFWLGMVEVAHRSDAEAGKREGYCFAEKLFVILPRSNENSSIHHSSIVCLHSPVPRGGRVHDDF